MSLPDYALSLHTTSTSYHRTTDSTPVSVHQYFLEVILPLKFITSIYLYTVCTYSTSIYVLVDSTILYQQFTIWFTEQYSEQWWVGCQIIRGVSGSISTVFNSWCRWCMCYGAYGADFPKNYLMHGASWCITNNTERVW